MMEVVDLEHFERALNKGLSPFELSLPHKEIERLYQHYLLLNQWSGVHNLTTIRSFNDIIYSHYVDSLVGASFLKPGSIAFDFGSGAGFPGLAAALLWRQTHVYLVESSRKKCSFLHLAALQMGLTNVEILQARVEEMEEIPFAITRATFSPPFISIAANALKKDAKLALWLGHVDRGILAQVLAECRLHITEEFVYGWEGIGSRRVLLLQKDN